MKLRTPTIAAFLIALLFCGLARAQQAIEQIPDDALIVLKVKNLDATSKKVGKAIKDLGMSEMMPGLDNPLALVQAQFNLSQGIRTDGDFAIVYRDPQKTNEGPDKSIVVLVPVTDFAAFVGNFGGAKPEGEITKIAMPHEGGEGYVAQWGNFAAVSPSRTVLEHKAAGALKVTGEATNRVLAGSDVVLLINMPGVRPQAQGALALARMQAGALEEGMGNDETLQRLAPVLRALVNQVLGGADAFVRDADAVTFSLNVGDDGFNGALMAEFNPTSYCGTLCASFKDSDAPLLKHLPVEKYLFLGGYVNQPEVAGKLVTDFFAPIVKEFDAMGPDMKSAHDYCDAVNAYIKAAGDTSFGIIAPTGMIGKESMIQVVSIAQGDVAAMKAAQQKMIQSEQEMMKSLNLPGADAYKMTLTPNAKTIDGVSFDMMSGGFNPNANDPAARRAQQMMTIMYGPNGLQMLQGDVAGKFVVAMGLNDELLSAVVAAAKADAAPMSDNPAIKSVSSHLPPKRVVEFYIPVDQIANTALNYMSSFGAGMNITIPNDLPPLGVSISTEGSAYRIEGYVPTALVSEMVKAGMGAYHQLDRGRGAPPTTEPSDNSGDDKDKGQ